MTVRRVHAARLRAVPAADDLMAQAREASARAYARYSNFKVGAAVRTASGAVYCGVNVENAAYPIGVCAEAAAISAAVLAEGPGVRLVAVAVSAERHGRPRPCSPCGACRQRIMELGRDAEVSFLAEDLSPVTLPAGSLLPHCFSLPTDKLASDEDDDAART